ncbi:hypothetical protein [Streptomyces sp. NBRC 110035]|uniref:hypothetical protein n=1 Tax=Streptomyces sp. NBRC 110035 TaxID=1547867 RepID=UPI0005A851CD|nr:hypothetical protein [Streptomyces sp. NBRC 110035]
MTDSQPTKTVTITLDAANSDRQYPSYQISINAMESETNGHGYRLMGSKYMGRSRNLRTVELTQRDADEIRAVLDEVFPPNPAAVLDEIADVLARAYDGQSLAELRDEHAALHLEAAAAVLAHLTARH